jgi:hypothetical protein
MVAPRSSAAKPGPNRTISIGALHRIPGLSTTFHQKRAADKQAGPHGLEASSSFEIGALDLGHGNLLLDARVRRVFVIDSTRHGRFLVGNDIQAGPDAAEFGQ